MDSCSSDKTFGVKVPNILRGRVFVLMAASLSLLSCSPKSIPIGVCLAGSKLAFWVGDAKRWFFFKSKARPWSVSVYGQKVSVHESVVGPAWETETRQNTYRLMRNLIVYGDKFPGWDIKTEAQPLQRGRKYSVEIWTDGGRGMIDVVPGSSFQPCSDAHP